MLSCLANQLRNMQRQRSFSPEREPVEAEMTRHCCQCAFDVSHASGVDKSLNCSRSIRVTDTCPNRHHAGDAGRRHVRLYTSKYGGRLWLGSLRTYRLRLIRNGGSRDRIHGCDHFEGHEVGI